MSLPEPSRRERKKEETRLRIFRAAVHLFREHGFEATTVDEITERSDVAKGTFFNYFPRKEAVLAYLAETRLATAETDAEGIITSARPVREKVIDLFRSAAQPWEQDRDLAGFVMTELMRRAFTPSEDVHDRWHALVRHLIEQGQAAGEVRREADADRAAVVLEVIYLGTLFTWVACCPGLDRPFDLRGEIGERLGLAFDGLTARGPVNGSAAAGAPAEGAR